MILFIVAIVVSSGCIVPTKDKSATTNTQSGGTNYLVPGTGATPQQQSQSSAQNAGTTNQNPTPTPIPDDTRYLTQVPTYEVTSDSGPTYRNLSFVIEPTATIPNYQEIYNNELSLKDYTVAYAYDLTNPPLIINFNIQPNIETRTMWYENRSGEFNSSRPSLLDPSRSDVLATTSQISPNAWFEIIVRDKSTGNIVLDEGFGKTFGSETMRTVSVRNYGNYQIDMSGNEVNAIVKMYIINTTR